MNRSATRCDSSREAARARCSRLRVLASPSFSWIKAHRRGGGTVWHCRVAKFWRPRCLHPSLRVVAFEDDESALRNVDVDVEEDSALRARWTHTGHDVADADEASYVAWLIVPASGRSLGLFTMCTNQPRSLAASGPSAHRRLDVRELQRVVARAVRGRGVPRQRRQGGGVEVVFGVRARAHGAAAHAQRAARRIGEGCPQCIRSEKLGSGGSAALRLAVTLTLALP
jgi:hypothetical protein